ncbi:MAG: hypothetical protein IJC07_00085 [Clostridia bacterium]|nr:hypothetical protein [Clostridia bacterium]
MLREKLKRFYDEYLPIISNLLIFVFAIVGFLVSCIYARRDGYYHWLTRLLYFTQQSNLWIGITSAVFAVMLIKGNVKEKYMKVISVLKYVFTVSITITGFIFCTVLAPFADFDIWTFATIVTHVVVPLLSIFDFFANGKILSASKKQVWLTFIPPLFYFIFAGILCVLKVDFGRGDPFPYFFMDFYSEVGLFGFVFKWPPEIGSFYWIVFFFGFIYLLGFVYRRIHLRLCNKRKNHKAR